MVKMRCCIVGGRTLAVTLGYVGDMVRGLMLAAASEACAGATYLLGDPRPYRVSEIIAAIEAALGRRAVTIRVPYVVGYLGTALVEMIAAARGREPAVSRTDLDGFLRFPYWTADTTKAARELGSRTTVPLAEGVQLAAAWYLEQGQI